MTDATRKIVGLMAFAVIFSVVGETFQKGKTPTTGTGVGGDAKIILGGTIGAALLSFLAETGPAGQQLGVGLATTATATAMLVKGAPVWDGLEKLFNSKATGTTGSTGKTGSTGSTNTADLATQKATTITGGTTI